MRKYKITDVMNDRELSLQELKEASSHRLNIAFALMSIIPFLVLFYVLAVRLFSINIVIGDVGMTLAVALLFCFLGYWVGYLIIRDLLDKIGVSYEKLKETRELLVQAEKFKAIGLLASGIAHEVKNPLATIAQGINNIEDNVQEAGKVVNTLNIMKRGVERADKIITALGDFSKASKMDMEALNINSILETTLLLIKHKIGSENITFAKELDNSLPEVWGDKIKMEQAFINIFMNAVQAMSGGGTLFMRTYKKKMAPQSEETTVVVEIEDTGAGISSENLKKIFNPFFTTKGPRGGTGLGLAVTRNIIDMHNGLISIDSKEGMGTKVTMVLGSLKG